MEKSIEELHKELSDKIAKLDQERKDSTERHSKEQQERHLIEEAARAEQVKKIRANEERLARLEEKKKEADERRKKEETEARIELERKQNALDEVILKKKAQVEWLEQEIAKAQFAEEQHRKSLEVSVAPCLAGHSEIVESSLPGEAAEGTDGATPKTPLMSEHLRRILRQAQQ